MYSTVSTYSWAEHWNKRESNNCYITLKYICVCLECSSLHATKASISGWNIKRYTLRTSILLLTAIIKFTLSGWLWHGHTTALRCYSLCLAMPAAAHFNTLCICYFPADTRKLLQTNFLYLKYIIIYTLFIAVILKH